MVEDRRPILRSDVVALAVERRRIVNHEEYLEDFHERHYVRVERDPDHLGMPGFPRADLRIGRVRGLPAHVSGLDRFHAPQIVEYRLQAPEASASKRRDFLCRVNHVVAFFPRSRAILSSRKPTSLQYAAWPDFSWKTRLIPRIRRRRSRATTRGRAIESSGKRSSARVAAGSRLGQARWASLSAASACSCSPP